MEFHNKNFMKRTVKPSIVILTIMCVFIGMTGLIGFTGLLYIVVSLFCVLFANMEISISILLINIVYFSYSYINVSFLTGWSNIDYINICNLFFTIRIVIESYGNNKLRIKLKKLKADEYILAILIIIYSLGYVEISIKNVAYQIFMLLSVLYVCRLIRNDEDFGNTFAVQFIVVLLSVYLYNMLQIDRYSTTHLYWVANRFVGVRDPNNFALQCNICMLFVIGYLKKNISNIKFYLIIMFLSVSSIITLSVSGFGTTVAILTYLLFTDKRSKLLKLIFVLLSTVSFGLIVLGDIRINSTAVFGSLLSRVTNIVHALESGDFYSATTTRSSLWEKYMASFNELSPIRRYIGSTEFTSNVGKLIGMSSHNNYIDILLNNGYIGLTIYITYLVFHIRNNLKNRYYTFAMINVVMVLNMFFRSMSGSIAWLGIII